jgi:hypothetical protein
MVRTLFTAMPCAAGVSFCDPKNGLDSARGGLRRRRDSFLQLGLDTGSETQYK